MSAFWFVRRCFDWAFARCRSRGAEIDRRQRWHRSVPRTALQTELLEDRLAPAIDFGDAPSVFPTLLAGDGARHTIVAGFQLGAAVDTDSDGQPTASADGDDADGNDDEDGVNMPAEIPRGDSFSLDVEVTNTAGVTAPRLDAWIDFNRDNVFDDSGGSLERVFSGAVSSGTNTFTVNVPGDAVLGTTYARFRLSDGGVALAPNGLASAGEVEDYVTRVAVFQTWYRDADSDSFGNPAVRLEAGSQPAGFVLVDGDCDDTNPFIFPGAVEIWDGLDNDCDGQDDEGIPPGDFGDAPLPYPTTWAEDGPRHTATGPRLGSNRDTESAGVHSAAADADDTAGVPDDEDGVTFGTIIVGQLNAEVTVNVQNAPIGAQLEAWIDFDGDGVWEGDEQIADTVTVANGSNPVLFDVPADAIAAVTFARFRLSTADALSPTGAAADGEIEDYRVVIAEQTDFGDAPFPYPTTLAENGARHGAVGPTFGPTRDGELDGVHSANADDDGSDEDGVTFGPIRVGQLDATVIVNVQNAPTGAKLDAWIDFDGDGNWGGPWERIAASVDVSNGNNTIEFDVPSDAKSGKTFTRFRLSTAGALAVTGPATDGEAEDYVVTLSAPIATFGAFGQPNVVSNSADNAYSVFAADIDGDGDVDLLSASASDNKVAWYENDGAQHFTERIITTNGLGPVSVFAADVDGDGDTDIIVPKSLARVIVWYENNGNSDPSFVEHIVTQENVLSPISVYAADIDADGDLDLMSASQNDAKIAWYENDGQFVPSFTQHVVSTDSFGAIAVRAADVDGDGDIDVVSASQADSTVAWFENDGAQYFTKSVVSDSANQARWVDASDVDGDGDIDLLSASRGDGKIAWYENNGAADPSFTERVVTNLLGDAECVEAADMDGDGDVDLVTVSWTNVGANEIAWYENNEQQFTPVIVPGTDWHIGSIHAADVDGDGDLDLLSASTADDTIAWYRNLEFDFGDAPSSYPTIVAENGPRHGNQGPTLGGAHDDEIDGAHSVSADADDLAGGPDDEDGLVSSVLFVGQTGTIVVNVQNAPSGAKLDAWIDFDDDSNWTGPLDQIANNESVINGNNTISFPVPTGTQPGAKQARFRLSTSGGLSFTGAANDGEVEDHLVTVQSPSHSPAGPEFQVNTTTPMQQNNPDIALDGDGDFVVVWQGLSPDAPLGVPHIFGQRYGADGSPLGAEFEISQNASVGHFDARVAADADGDFVVVWTSYEATSANVNARRYNAAGQPLGAAFRVNTTEPGIQKLPAVAVDAAGNFVVAWQDNSSGNTQIVAQLYSANGLALGGEFTVNATTPGSQTTPSVAMAPSGEFVVTWESPDGGGGGFDVGIFARRFDRTGVALDVNDIPVNTTLPNIQLAPTVAIDDDGDFVIAWTAYNQDGSYTGVYARRFSPAGVATSSEFRVNTETLFSQHLPDVAMSATGRFVVTWTSQDASQDGVFAQLFDAAGMPVDGEFRVNQTTAGSQTNSAVSLDRDGNVVVAWAGQPAGGNSGDLDIYARRYAEPTDIASPLAAGLFVEQTPVFDGDTLPREVDYLTFSFSEQVSTTAGPGNVKNPGSWTLQDSNGPMAGAVDRVGFGFNPTTNRFEANVVFSSGLPTGDYTITLDDAVRDVVGNALDGDYNGVPGGDFSISFSVQTPSTDEFRVNTRTNLAQFEPAVAVDADGDFVVAWTSNGQDGAGYGVYAQRYDRSGNTLGTEFRVNTFTTGDQKQPAVAMDADGDFVVVWHSAAQDGDGSGVFGQRFDSSGRTVGPEFQVNRSTAGDQSEPAVAMDVDGDFVVVWTSYNQDGSFHGVYAQRYDATGVRAGTEFRVNTFTASTQWQPAVAMDADGDFVVAWSSYFQDTDDFGIYARRFDEEANPSGNEFRVNTVTTGAQERPAIAMDYAGRFVVTWQGPNDGNDLGVFAQRFNANGTAAGGEFRVNTQTAGKQQQPTIAMDSDGDFLITWSSLNQDGSGYGIYAQRYFADGMTDGAEVLVNQTTASDQHLPAVAMDADGDTVIAWQSENQDGSSYGVYARRSNGPADNTGPVVTGVFHNGNPIPDGERQVQEISLLVVAFSENMSIFDGDTGANSVVNPSNWQLIRDGATVPGAVSSVVFGFNSSTNRYESAVAFAIRLTDGSYVLRITDEIHDVLGNGLNGDFSGAVSSDFDAAFVVALPAPLGPEFQVNSTTSDSQDSPAVALAPSGGSVVVWRTDNDIRGQLFAAQGTPLGDEFVVADSGSASRGIDVAFAANGDFVVVWGFGAVSARRFNALGEPLGDAFQVPSPNQSAEVEPAVAMAPDGRFVVVWNSAHEEDGSDEGIFGRIFSPDGSPLAPHFQVNEVSAGAQYLPDVGMDANGNFVVAWVGPMRLSGPERNIIARLFDSTGTPRTPDIQVDAAHDAYEPKVMMALTGEFAVTWTDFASYSIHWRRFNDSGIPLSGPLRVNEASQEQTPGERYPTLALDDDGDSVISWVSPSDEILAKRFDSSGTAIGTVFQVNTTTADIQSFPSVGVSPSGDYVIAWQSRGQDRSSYGIYAQRYADTRGIDLTPPRAVSVLTQNDEITNDERVVHEVSQLTVAFSKDMSVVGGATGVTSVTNPANWSLARNGQAVVGAISNITFSFNADRGTHEATLQLSEAFRDGSFALTALDTMTDTLGYRLDGDRSGEMGGNATFTFSISVPETAGTEFIVSTTPAAQLDDLASALAADAAGNVVVAWMQGSDVFVRRYDAAGVAQGAVVQANSVTAARGRLVDVEMDADGDFVLVWESDTPSGIYARRFDESAVPQGAEFQVNATSTGFETSPALAVGGAGDFVVTWSAAGTGVLGRRFDSVGNPLGGEFTVNTFSNGQQGFPAIAMDSDGDFVITWESVDQDGSAEGVFGQRFDALGMRSGSEFRVNQFTAGFQGDTSVAMAPGGSFVVAWSSEQDGSGEGAYARRYAADGTPLGDEFQVNQFTLGDQLLGERTGTVAIDDNGNVVFVWQSEAQDGSGFGVFARRYNSAGVPIGDEFRVNTFRTGDQVEPAVTVDADGDFVVAWAGGFPDGSGFGIHAQRFYAPAADRFENNDVPIQATNFGTLAGTHVETGLSIHNSADVDWFRFRTSEVATLGHFVQVDFQGEQGDLTLELHDVLEGRLRSSLSVGNNERILLNGLPAGTYRVKVIGTDSATNPDYTITVVAPQPSGADRFEDNDSLGNATDLGTVTSELVEQGLSIHTAADEDWYEFHIDAAGQDGHFARIEFTHAQGDLDLGLYTGSAVLIDQSATASDNEEIGLAGLPSGTYLLQVRSLGGVTNPDYALRIVPPATVSSDRFELPTVNDSFAAATRLGAANGGVEFANLSIHTSDVDFFQFSTIGASTASHELALAFNRSLGELQLRLFNAAEMELRVSTPRAAGAVLSLDGLPADAYYVKVEPAGVATNTYSLTIDVPDRPVNPVDEWTILVYMTASDLAGRAFNDINELEFAATRFEGKVNVVVYLDQASATPFETGDGAQAPWGGAGRAVIEPDSGLGRIATTFEIFSEGQAGASGDPATLLDFVRWGILQRPAERTALILWGHGLGVFGSNFDNHDPDPSPLDELEISEVATALQTLQAVDQHRFDIIAYDASLMGMAEVVDAIGAHTDVLVASEQVGESLGFDYDKALFSILDLTADEIDARAVASQFVETYKDRYSSRSTLAGFDMNRFGAFAAALNVFVSTIVGPGGTVLATGTDFEAIDDARSGARAFVRPEFRDVGTFLLAVANNGGVTAAIRTAAQAAYDALRQMIIAEATNPQTLSSLSIYFPDDLATPEAQAYFGLYEDFDQPTRWFDFLEAFTDSAGSKAGTYDPDRFESPERNDQTSLAHRFYTLAGSTAFDSLTLDRLGDKDFFRFSIAAAGGASNRVRIVHDHQIEGAASSIQLTLFEDDGFGTQIGSPVDTVSGQGSISLSTLAAGDYFVRIQASGVVPRYTMTIDAPATAPAADRAGDNGTREKAFEVTGIANDPIFTGFVLTPPAADWFRFDAPPVVNPRPKIISVVTSSPETIRLRLFDSAGTELDSAEGTARIDLTAILAAGASHFLEVSTTGGQPVSYAIEFTTVANVPPVIPAAQTFSVSEDVANNAVVGVVVATDLDPNTTLRDWTITGGNTGNAFAINPSTGQIIVANAAALDGAAAPFALQVTVSDGVNTSAAQVVMVTVIDVTVSPPVVTAVETRGSGWTDVPWQPIATGQAQLNSLSWSSLDQIRLRFSEDVTVTQGHLTIVGSSSTYAVASFAYDTQTFSATWTLTRPIIADKLLLTLSDSVQDTGGEQLDGEWNGVGDTYPSGDGAAGGDFVFRLNVLPGDTDGNARVDVVDSLLARLRVGQQMGSASYNSAYDIDANARIDVLDALLIRLRVGQTLPANEPGLRPASTSATAARRRMVVPPSSAPTLTAASVDDLLARWSRLQPSSRRR